MKELRRLIGILEDTIRDLVEYEHERFPEKAELAYRKREHKRARLALQEFIEKSLT